VRALVTGASGFLGGRLVKLLLEQGTPVCVLARSSSLLKERAGQTVLRGELGAAPDAELVAGLAQVTHVFHCAGCSTDWAPLAQYVAANVDGVAGMLRLALGYMPLLERFVHVSTTDVYGYPVVAGDEAQPHVDTGLPYNQTKLRGEALVWDAARAGLPVTVVRPASIYGPGGKAFVTDIVTLLRQRLMLLVAGGRAPGGFVYVDDVCRGMLLAAAAPGAVGEAYNLSSVDGTSWKTYTRVLAAALGLPAPWLQLPFGAAMGLAAVSELPHKAGLPGKPLLTRHAVYLLARDQEYETAKAREELGWLPMVGLQDGVRRAVAG
jgi:nucleoside-diphosphate-sugar epimerase